MTNPTTSSYELPVSGDTVELRKRLTYGQVSDLSRRQKAGEFDDFSVMTEMIIMAGISRKRGEEVVEFTKENLEALPHKDVQFLGDNLAGISQDKAEQTKNS